MKSRLLRDPKPQLSDVLSPIFGPHVEVAFLSRRIFGFDGYYAAKLRVPPVAVEQRQQADLKVVRGDNVSRGRGYEVGTGHRPEYQYAAQPEPASELGVDAYSVNVLRECVVIMVEVVI